MLIIQIKNVAKSTFLYGLVSQYQVWNWERDGKPSPPPHKIKRDAIKEYAFRFTLDTLIETGTFRGDMVDATRNTFKNIISIEIDPKLHAMACKRFSRFDHIEIILGDSSKMLTKKLNNISKPCLFWLDGHYSGGNTGRGKQDSPIFDEIHAVLNHPIKEHIILIDDAREFTGENGYPTLEELRQVTQVQYKYFEVKDDIIRIHQ